MRAQDLSDSIYHDLDKLVESYPSLTSINTIQLKVGEQYSNLKTNKERLALVIMRCNLAFYLKEYDKHFDAMQQYQKAWKVYNSYNLANYDIIEYCLKPLGNLLTITGNYADAESIITQYMKMAKSEKNDEAYTAGVINLSVVYNNIGNYQDALQLLEKHLKRGKLNKDQLRLIENNITSNMLAMKMHEEVKQKVEDKEVKSISGLKIKAQTHIENKEYAKARKIFKEIETLFKNKKSPRQLAKFYVDQASFYHLISEGDSARLLLNRAFKLLLPSVEIEELWTNKSLLYPENTFVAIFDAFAQYSDEVYLKLEYYKLSFYVEELLLEKINDPKSKLFFQTSYRKRSEKCLKLLFDNYIKNGNDSMIWEALRYAENSKVRVLKESANRKTLLEQNPDDSLLIKEQKLLSRQQLLIGKLIRKQLSNSNQELEKLNQDFIDLSQELREIKIEVEEYYPEIYDDKLQVEALRQQLKNDRAQMLYYFYGEQDLYSFSINHEDISWYKSPLDNRFQALLIELIKSFESSSLINSNVEKYVNSAFQLSQILGHGINAKHENLIIIPDGLLSFLPFEALLFNKVDHSNFRKMPFWFKEYSIIYNLSSDVYIQNQNELKLENLYGSFPIFKGTTQYLKYSEKEASLIAGNFEESIDKYQNATKSNFLTKANKYDILHLSTHAAGGTFSIPAYIEFADDVLLLPELYAQNLESSLVVLSACETGIGEIIKGATPMSLARGFQYAGVQNILMTQWQVNDFATSKLMKDFYRALAETNSPSNSMREARISYLEDKSISNLEKSPYYWAGFTYYGKLKEEKQFLFDLQFLLILGCVAIIAFFVFYRVRQINKKLKS